MQRRRILTLLFFVCLCLVLAPYFFLQTRAAIPKLLSPVVGGMAKLLSLESAVVVSPEGNKLLALPVSRAEDPLIASGVAEHIREYRTRFGFSNLPSNPELTLVAQKLADAIADNTDHYDDIPFETLISSYAHDSKTPFTAISHVSVVGPSTTQAAFAAFVSNDEQSTFLLDPIAEVFAVATRSAEYQAAPADITVVLLARIVPKTQAVANASATVSTSNLSFPEISNTAMLLALNEYRKDHGIPQLVENQFLCQYAQKRVGDLVAYGGLDGHEGFRNDFADLDNLPEPIKQYPGGKIGENLAYQHCRNMTTGDGFVAETATSLIEWCFDSSTKGHREAQLNPNFTASCTRHQNGLFVVIFGE